MQMHETLRKGGLLHDFIHSKVFVHMDLVNMEPLDVNVIGLLAYMAMQNNPMRANPFLLYT